MLEFPVKCGAAIPTLSINEVEYKMSELTQTDPICSACGTHCWAVRTFPRFSVVEVFNLFREQ